MKVTGIGGGHGLSTTLKAARTYSEDVQAVVTVADDGGSSGQLARELGIPPPGDIRNCLVALSDDGELARLYQHRFASGFLSGHCIGNLAIAALTQMMGDFAAAVHEAGRLVGAKGAVHPATTELISLRALTRSGVISGQVAIAQSRAPIQAVYLEPPHPSANDAAVEAILSADQVILGPGSIFTSLIATLLVPEIRSALQHTKACRVFVCNSRIQKGETQGLDAAAHLEALFAHLGPYAVDVTIVQTPPLAGDGVAVDRSALDFLGMRVVGADVALPTGPHDPHRLGSTLASLL